MSLQDILPLLDHLTREELEQLNAQIQERRLGIRRAEGTPEERIARLHKALGNFWEGFTTQEVNDIIADMNQEYIEPEDLSLFDWIDGEGKS